MHCWLSLQFKITQSFESKEKVSKDTSSKQYVSDFANCISTCTQCINRHWLYVFLMMLHKTTEKSLDAISHWWLSIYLLIKSLIRCIIANA